MPLNAKVVSTKQTSILRSIECSTRQVRWDSVHHCPFINTDSSPKNMAVNDQFSKSEWSLLQKIKNEAFQQRTRTE